MPRFATSAMTIVRLLAVGELIARRRRLHQRAALDHRVDILEQPDVGGRDRRRPRRNRRSGRPRSPDICSRPSASAALSVAAWIASSGVIPYSTMVANWRATLPCGITPGVGPEHHPHPGAVRLAEIVALDLADLAVLAEVLLELAVLLAFGLGVFGVLDIHRKPHRPLRSRGQADALVVDQAGMLDGVDPGPDRGPDAVGAVGVGGDPQAPCAPRRRSRAARPRSAAAGPAVSRREHAAGGADLDHFGADTCAGGGPGSGAPRRCRRRLPPWPPFPGWAAG